MALSQLGSDQGSWGAVSYPGVELAFEPDLVARSACGQWAPLS